MRRVNIEVWAIHVEVERGVFFYNVAVRIWDPKWLTMCVALGNLYIYTLYMPVPVAERFKAWVCGRSPAKIVGSNPAGGMDVCLL